MKTPRPREYGFTLLEILIALSIFGIIASTLFVAYRALFADTDTFAKGLQRYEQAQACFYRMRSDLYAVKVTTAPLYSAPEQDGPADLYRILGQATYSGDATFGTLRFTSLAHVPVGSEHQVGIAEIRYYVQEDADRKFVLRRSDHRYPFPDFQKINTDPVLCENVKTLKFFYYDIEGEPHESWDSDSEETNYTTPASIGIELEIGDDTSSAAFETRIALPVIREGRG